MILRVWDHDIGHCLGPYNLPPVGSDSYSRLATWRLQDSVRWRHVFNKLPFGDGAVQWHAIRLVRMVLQSGRDLTNTWWLSKLLSFFGSPKY